VIDKRVLKLVSHIERAVSTSFDCYGTELEIWSRTAWKLFLDFPARDICHSYNRVDVDLLLRVNHEGLRERIAISAHVHTSF
jgi:hypothetical protein